MYGLIGKRVALSGLRDALIDIRLESINDMPGCLSCVAAKDPTDPHAIWITEVRDDEQSHRASLSPPAVRRAITRSEPLIASFASSAAAQPVGGYGIVRGDGG